MEYKKENGKIIYRNDVEYSEEQVLQEIEFIESTLLNVESEKVRLTAKLNLLKGLGVVRE